MLADRGDPASQAISSASMSTAPSKASAASTPVGVPISPISTGSGAYLSAGGVWQNVSSRERKENIKELTTADALGALAALNPVTFNYKVDAQEKHVGFIAEDVPELVASKDRKGLSGLDIVAVLTKVVQEKSATIDRLQQKLESQQKALDTFETVTKAQLSQLMAEVQRLKSLNMTAQR